MKKSTTLMTTALVLGTLQMAPTTVKAESVEGRYGDKTISENIEDLGKGLEKLWKKIKKEADTKSAKDIVDGIIKKVDNWSPIKTKLDVPTYGDSYDYLASLDFQSGMPMTISVNNNTPEWTFDWTGSKIVYSELDSLNRAGSATAYLDYENVGKSEGREGQTFLPTGYHKNGKQDRGHLIAYTLSFGFDDNGQPKKGAEGSLNNPKNLFTQTSASNRGDMQEVEKEVRNRLKKGEKVIYKVTPVFRGDELMARGVWVEAVSEHGTTVFSKYIFNVADGYEYDYKTGRKTISQKMHVN